MVSNFNERYIQVLRDQVVMEIQFLESHGHAGTTATKPCIFCSPKYKGMTTLNQSDYVCGRLNQLYDFKEFLDIKQYGKKSQSEWPELNTRAHSEAPSLEENGLLKLSEKIPEKTFSWD